MANDGRDLWQAGSGADAVCRATVFRAYARGTNRQLPHSRSLLTAVAIAATTLAACSPDVVEAPDPAGSSMTAAPPEEEEAGLVDLTCLGTNEARFSPGLTLATRTVDIEAEGEYTNCVSSDPAVTSGTYTASGEGTMSCLAGGHAGKFTITWNTGEESTIEFTNIVALRPGGEMVVVATGSVIGGKFVGDQYNGTFTLFQTQPIACLTPQGVREATGPTTLLFTSL